MTKHQMLLAIKEHAAQQQILLHHQQSNTDKNTAAATTSNSGRSKKSSQEQSTLLAEGEENVWIGDDIVSKFIHRIKQEKLTENDFFGQQTLLSSSGQKQSYPNW